jgi:hypothetical protein
MQGGESAIDAYLKAFPTDNRQHAIKSSRVLFKQTRIQKLMKKEAREAGDKAGVSDVFVFKQMKKRILDKDFPKDLGVELLRELIEIYELKPSERTVEALSWYSQGRIGEGEESKLLKGGALKIEGKIEEKIED